MIPLTGGTRVLRYIGTESRMMVGAGERHGKLLFNRFKSFICKMRKILWMDNESSLHSDVNVLNATELPTLTNA